MNTPNTFSIPSIVPAKVLANFKSILLGSAVLGLLFLCAESMAQVRRDQISTPTGRCMNCGSDSSGSSSGSSSSGSGGLFGIFRSDPGVDPAEQARQQRRSEALAANKQGIEFQNAGDWARAVASYQEAANKDPDDPIIRENLARAKQALANAQEQLRNEQQARASADRMTQSIQNFAQTLSAAPASGGLDFDGRTAGSAPGGGGNSGGLDFTASVAPPSQARPASPVPSSDPRVVDARNVPSGLPKPMDNAIAAAYRNAPPGVSDRVRKGFQAVMDRDWKVAKAWFEDALNRDPGNADLKRLVALADSTPGNRQTTALTAEQRRRLETPNPDDIRFLFPGMQSDDAVAMDALFGLPPRR